MPISDTLKTLFDMMAAPVSIFDLRGDEIYNCHYNPAAELYFGLCNAEVTNLPIGSRPPPGSKIYHTQIARLRKNINTCVANKSQLQRESKYLLPNGRSRWARHSFVPLTDDAGKVIQVMLTSIEVTKLVEAKLKLAETMTKVLSGFVTICSGCKKIRHEKQWLAIDTYAAQHMDYHDFSEGLCDSCNSCDKKGK